MVDELLKPKVRRKADGYGGLYLGAAVKETEKPLLTRRLRRVLRGFNLKDIKKVREIKDGDPQYDHDAITEQITFSLDLLSDKVLSVDRAKSSVQASKTFKKLRTIVEDPESSEVSDLDLRAISLLTVITLALLNDREPSAKTVLLPEITSDTLTLYITPEHVIDSSIHPNIKSIILSRTVGAELAIVSDARCSLCYRVTVSRCGKYLYEVRRAPREFWIDLL